MQKRFYIKTLGCKVNQYESQVMRERLVKAGFGESDATDSADILILNSCTVTHKADKEARYLVESFHRANPNARIVVTGCSVEDDASGITTLPGVSDVVRNSEKYMVDRIACKQTLAKEGQSPVGTVPLLPRDDGIEEVISGFKDHTKAFVKIQDGCDNFCSYCKVPLVRSVLRSKPREVILEEVAGLVSNGYKEIVLTGICLGAWGNGGLVDVLMMLAGIKGDFRIRLSSIEPKYVTDELINFIASETKICKHLHIPLQSGDDEILSAMNRPYTAKEYLHMVEKAKSRIKDLAITTDALIGFPGEGESNFNNTASVLKEILPARTHIFTFSKRKGTKAYDLKDDTDPAEHKRRYTKLKAIALGASCAYRNMCLGKRLKVLVETKRDPETGLLNGYSDNYIKVWFSGKDELKGTIADVSVTSMTLSYTFGIKI